MEYRGYNIISDGTFSMYEIKRKGSGPVSIPLRGKYATTELARKFIDSYEDAKGNKNAKSRSSSKD